MDIPQVEVSFQYINLLVILIGIVVMLYLLSKKYARRRVLMFGNYETLEKVAGRKLLTTSLVPLALRMIAVILIILLISDLVVIKEDYVSRTDFVLAIDTSSSMLTPDYDPDRLEFVKETTIEFISRLRNTEVGLITFAGKAHVRLKPTDDMDEVEREIDRIGFESPAGTAIGDALVVAESLFEDTERNKSIILITDGINNMGRNITYALTAFNESNTTIYPIGIGSRIEEPETTVPTGLMGLNATATKFPNLDEDMLKLIANTTQGEYFIIDDEDSLKKAFETGLDYTEVENDQTKNLVLLLCLVLILDWGLEVTKFRVVP